MRKMFLIAKSNMKKTKITVGALIFLVMVSAVLLYCCFAVLLDVDSFVERKNDSLNGTKFQLMSAEGYQKQMVPLIHEVGGFEDQQTVQGIRYENASIRNTTANEKPSSMSLLFMNADEKTRYNKVQIIDKAAKWESNAVILPYVLKSAGGYKVGDTVRLSVREHTLDLKVNGFYEDVIFSNPANMMTYKIYVFGNTFSEMYHSCNKGERVFLSYIKLKEGTDASKFELEYGDKVAKEFDGNRPWFFGLDYNSMKQGTMAFVKIMVSILMGLGAILLIIIVVVIRFSIVTQLESYMTSIGILKASGFTSRQLIASLVWEFGIITLVGWLLGMAVSILASPIVGNLVSASMGLNWISKINPTGIVISFLALMLMVMVTTLVTLRKIKKITPLVALRKGVENFEFRKNHFDLEKTNAGPVTSLGVKSAFHSGKQNRVLFVLLLVFSFACTFCWVWYYNFVYKGDGLIRLIGSETNDITITGVQNYNKDKEELKIFPEVDFTLGHSGIAIEYNKGGESISTTTSVYEDFDKLKNLNLQEGRCPKHDNEVVITTMVAKKLQVDVGDQIVAKYNGKKYDFLVVGINQQISMLGKWAGLTEKAIQRMEPNFKYASIYVYLKKGANVKKVCSELENKYKDESAHLTNSLETFNDTAKSFANAMRDMVIACIIFTVVIISTIMYLILKVKIIRERQQLGIWKAMGFTTPQLIGQVVVSVLPSLLVGSSLGIVLGYFGINPLLSGLLSFAGVRKIDFCIVWYDCFAICAGLLLLACLVSALVSLRIRKINPSKLLQED